MAKQMKSSGITWIGDIPNDWTISKIKYNVLIPVTDGPHETPVFVDDGVPFYSVDGIQKDKIIYEPCRYISNEDANRYDIKAKPMYGDILMGKAASVGKIAIIDRHMRLQVWSPLAIIRTNETKLNNRYLKYYLLSEPAQVEINLKSTSNTQKNIAMEDIENIVVAIPSVEEQQLIADFLDERCEQIDSIIADIEKQIEILQKYKKSLITETVTKGLDKTVSMKNSGIEWLGDIPEHWNVKRLKFIFEKSENCLKVGPFGSALSGDDYTDEGKWVYNQRVVLDNNFEENSTCVSEQKYKEMLSFKVYPKDILITTRGTIGKVAIVPQSMKEGILHPCIIKFRIDDEIYNAELLILIFNESDFVKEQFALMSNATTIEVIYSYSLKDLILPVMPMKEQHEIYSYLHRRCKTVDDIIDNKNSQLETIKQHKKSLIYEYVTGKKRVKEAL